MHRSSRTPRDAGREFHRNPLASASRRNSTSTSETSRNRNPRNLGVRPTLIAVASTLAFVMAACQDASAPDQSQLTSPPETPAVSSIVKNPIPDEYIVVLEDGVSDVDGRAKGLLNAHGGNLHATYRAALKGFSAHMSARAAEAIANDPDVAYVEPDEKFALASTQT